MKANDAALVLAIAVAILISLILVAMFLAVGSPTIASLLT